MFIKKFFTILLSLALLCAGSVAWSQDNYLVNGDFEDTTDWLAAGPLPPSQGPPGWTVDPSWINPVSQQSGVNAIGGSGTSAYFPVTSSPDTRGSLYQWRDDPTVPNWQLDVDFATEDPGGSGDRSFNGSICNARITFRVNGDGDFQLYDSDGFLWHTPTGLAGSVIFDDDVQTTPLTHHLTFIGHWDLPTTSIDVIVTDSNNNVHQALGLTDRWNSGGNPATGMGLSEKIIEFSSLPVLEDVNFVVDNWSLVPEPSAAVLLLGVFAGLMICRRRN